MKNIITVFVLLQLSINLQAQFGIADPCNVNVNTFNYQNLPYRKPNIDATFLWQFKEGACSATLVNRDESDDKVGYYFITARHCVTDGTGANDPTIDFSVDQRLQFNYQSPDDKNSSVPSTNLGLTIRQSNLYPSTNPPPVHPYSSYGYQYNHTTKVRMVSRFFWGDFALCEILTPIPPHFNVTYSGWNPSRFYNGFSIGIGGLPTLPSHYAGVSHPRRDVKKVWGANNVLWLENPLSTGCYTITSIIDLLFGWIWGRTASTQVICNYVDNPWMVIPSLSYGAVQKGSSGSGIFNGNKDHIGQLSGSLGTCGQYFPTFGKLHSNYYNASVKNTLNPNHDWWIDINGLESRQITCYDNLTLPGAYGVSGEYFPAKDYQSDNKMRLQANNTIETTQPINIYPDADYTFRAGTSVTLNAGFEAQAGSTFTAEISPCASINKKSESSEMEERLLNALSRIELPNRLDFKTAFNFENSIISLYPNPASDQCTVRVDIPEAATVAITLSDMTGRLVQHISNSPREQGTSFIPFSTADIAPGMYIVTYSDGTHTVSKKLSIAHGY
jgi:hypothetical protein